MSTNPDVFAIAPNRPLKKVVDPVADARGSVYVIDNAKPTQNRERERPGPDLCFSTLLASRDHRERSIRQVTAAALPITLDPTNFNRPRQSRSGSR